MTQATPVRVLSDAAIARRAGSGSRRAFAAIFERYNQDLYRYCAAILGNAEDAQDAVQNTMLKVLRALPGEERELKLKPWLYRIAHNEAIDMIRARRDSEQIDAEALVGFGGPAEKAEARARLQQLISDIAELPPRQRGALVMREMSGLGYEQIGEALQTSPAVARQTIYEARLSLRQMSEGREMPCQEVMRAISDDDGRVLRRRDIRAHLHRCKGCKAFRAEISDRRREFAALAPLPAAASAAILQGLLGGAGGGASGVGGASALGAVAGKTLAGSAAVKSAAALLAVSAIGVVAANRSGVVDLGVGGRHEPAVRRTPPSPQTPGQAAATTRAPHPVFGTIGPATSIRHGGRSDLRKASALAARNRRSASEASPPGLAAEQGSRSNGRHLGESNGSEHGKGLDRSSGPAKGTKGASETSPGHTKSPGQAQGGAAGKPAGQAAAESRPAHSEHPAHPDQSQAAAPQAEAGAPAENEPGSGGHGKPTAE
jgi:RNA polymerase sigma factor (sigma-70 family)